MACKITDKRLITIKKMVAALVKDGKAKTLEDVHQWFKDNRPSISGKEINESLVATSESRKKEIKSDLEKTQLAINSRSTHVKILRNNISLLSLNDTKKNLENRLKDVRKSLISLSNLVQKSPKDLETKSISDMIKNINDIANQFDDFLMGKSEFKAENLEGVKASLKELENNLEVNKADTKLAAIKDKLEKLRTGEITVDELTDLNHHVFISETSKAIQEKENEIDHIKAVYEKYIEDKVDEARIRETGLMGFKGETAIKVKTFIDATMKHGFELERTIKFMFDISVVGVQLAPYVITTLFTNPTKLTRLFKNNIFDVLQSDLTALRTELTYNPDQTPEENKKRRWRALKESRGRAAQDQYQKMVTDPYFPMVSKTILQLSKPKSVVFSEEMFHDTTLNRVAIAGIMKDISENMMTTPLNFVRFNLMKEFIIANPGVSLEEMNKVAGLMNAQTGTDSMVSSKVLSSIFSAVKLTASRLKLVFKYNPLYAASGIDVKESFSQGGLRFQSPADRYVAKEITKMWGAYTASFTILAGIAALRNDYCEKCPHLDMTLNWEESDWLKLTAGNLAIDYTGGIGAIMRMLAAMKMIGHTPEDANPLTKNRLQMQKLAHERLIDPAINTLFKNKLHPTPQLGIQLYTGKDFMDKPLTPHEWSSRLELAARAFSPISIETIMDLYKDKNTGTAGKIAGDILQTFGSNVFPYEDKSAAPFYKRYFNTVVGSKPSAAYPDELSKKGIEESFAVQYMRNEYKNLHGTMMANIIDENPHLNKSAFLSKVSSGEVKLQREFLNNNKEVIKEIKALRKTSQAKK